MIDIVERLEGSLKVVPTHMLRNGDIAEAGSCIKHQRAEIERLRTALQEVQEAKMPGAARSIAWRALQQRSSPSAVKEKS